MSSQEVNVTRREKKMSVEKLGKIMRIAWHVLIILLVSFFINVSIFFLIAGGRYVRALVRADYAWTRRDCPTAIKYYERALRIKPQDIPIHYQLARLYRRTGDYNKALDEYEKLRAHRPKWSNLERYLGETYYEMGDYKAAIEQLTKYYNYNRKHNVEGLLWRAKSYYAQRNYEAATKDLQDIIDRGEHYSCEDEARRLLLEIKEKTMDEREDEEVEG